MKKGVLIGRKELLDLFARATAAQPHESETRAALGRLPPEIAQFYVNAPSNVMALISEVRRVQADLQRSLRLSVTQGDTAGKIRHSDVAEVGKKRRDKRRKDVDESAKKGRTK